MLSYLDETRPIQDILDQDRHWCAISEPFTGCDALFAALQQGWTINGVVFCQQFPLTGRQTTQVYYFQLIARERIVRMPVVSSPHVERFIIQHDLPVYWINRAPVSEAVAARQDASERETQEYARAGVA